MRSTICLSTVYLAWGHTVHMHSHGIPAGFEPIYHNTSSSRQTVLNAPIRVVLHGCSNTRSVNCELLSNNMLVVLRTMINIIATLDGAKLKSSFHNN